MLFKGKCEYFVVIHYGIYTVVVSMKKKDENQQTTTYVAYLDIKYTTLGEKGHTFYIIRCYIKLLYSLWENPENLVYHASLYLDVTTGKS